MEIFSLLHRYLLLNISLFFFAATDLLLAWNPICLGLVEGVIGKVQLHSGMCFVGKVGRVTITGLIVLIFYCLKTGALFFFAATDLLLAWNPICLGLVEGVIGKVQLHSGMCFVLF
uniref:Uncharacterized protein n=1 Tax=Ficedula albicollis TaxID=59894 RepID=A0A803V6Z0_FICAL